MKRGFTTREDHEFDSDYAEGLLLSQFDLGTLKAADGEELLHRHAYYTVNEIPRAH